MNKIIGNIGEEIAKNYLVKKDYTIIARQYYSLFGEIDIITKAPNGTLVFCEVKYYKKNSLVHPIHSITKRKQKRILKTAEYYLYKNNIVNNPIRFDILIVEKKIIKYHLENIILKYL